MIRISDAELEVMKVIWEKGETTSLEIINALKYCNWNDNTVRTLINRLISKKAVGISKKNGKTYTYVPLIEQDDYQLKRSRNFVKQFFGGSVKDMILNFIDNDELTEKDLQELMDKVNKKKKTGGK